MMIDETRFQSDIQTVDNAVVGHQKIIRSTKKVVKPKKKNILHFLNDQNDMKPKINKSQNGT